MPSAVRLIVNPSNTAQKYRLWDTGVIDAIGGAIPIPGSAFGITDNWAVDKPARSIQITDWTTPSGYVLDYFGIVHAFGGATAPGSQINSNAGFSPLGIAVDFVMNPSANGNGHVLDFSGTLWAVNTQTPVASGVSVGNLARRLAWDWASGKGYILDGWGGMHPVGGAPTITSGTYWPNWDIARDVVIFDWATGQGWVLDGWGGVHPLNGADDVPGYPYWSGWDIARDLSINSLSPLSLSELDGQGGIHTWTISTNPRAEPGGPADPTSDTTRPTIALGYVDADGNPRSKAEAVLFRKADTLGFLNEKQTLTRQGSPTTGTFKIHLEGSATGTIARNASAATIQTAIRTLPGCSQVTCTGGALGTAPVVVDFGGGSRAGSPQLLLKIVENTMDGAGKVAVTRTQVAAGPQGRAAVIKSWTVTDPTQIGITLDFDLANDDYRYYLRVWDNSGLRSGWRKYDWTQSVTRPTAPTLTATDRGGAGGIAVGLTLNSPPADALVDVEFSDDYNPYLSPNEATWRHLRGLVVPGTGDTVVASDPVLRGTLMGFNAFPTAANILEAVGVGAKYLRWAEEWQWMQPTSSPASLDTSGLETDINNCHGAGLGVIHALLGVPTWVNAHSNVSYPASGSYGAISASGHWFPTDQAGCDLMADWAESIVALLDPDLDYVEIWNEPNIESFNRGLYQNGRTGTGAPFYQSEADYARMCVTLIERIRAVRPGLRIILGSIAASGDIYNTSNPPVNSMTNYTVRTVFYEPRLLTTHRPDIWGVHPYNWGGGNNAGLDTPTTDPATLAAQHLVRTSGTAYKTSSPKTTKGWNGHVQASQLRDTLISFGVANPKLMVTEVGAPGARQTESVAFTGISRTSNVVTATGMVNHGLQVGDTVVCDAPSTGFDGTFTITAKTSTQVSWNHTGSNASAGAGTLSWASVPYTQGYTETWQQQHMREDLEVGFHRIGAGIYIAPYCVHTIPEDTSQSITAPDRYMGIYRSDNNIKPAGTEFAAWADDVVANGSTTTVPGHPPLLIDFEAPFTVPRYYRAQVYSLDPFIASAWSPVVSAKLSQPDWYLSIPGNGFVQVQVSVRQPFTPSYPVVSYAAEPSGAEGYSAVVSDGGLRGAEFDLNLRTLDPADYNLIKAIVDFDGTILLRNPFGHVWYLKKNGSVKTSILRAAPDASGDPSWQIRQAYEWTIPVKQVDYPSLGTDDIAAETLLA